jgi:hypothetical protein
MVAAVFAGVVFAQSGTSTLLGTLVDPANAVVPNGSVAVVEQETGAVSKSVSNETGVFRFLSLRPGRYNLTVEVGGFRSYEIKDIQLASSENRDLGRLTLQVGSLVEQLSVTGASGYLVAPGARSRPPQWK